MHRHHRLPLPEPRNRKLRGHIEENPRLTHRCIEDTNRLKDSGKINEIAHKPNNKPQLHSLHSPSQPAERLGQHRNAPLLRQ